MDDWSFRHYLARHLDYGNSPFPHLSTRKLVLSRVGWQRLLNHLLHFFSNLNHLKLKHSAWSNSLEIIENTSSSSPYLNYKYFNWRWFDVCLGRMLMKTSRELWSFIRCHLAGPSSCWLGNSSLTRRDLQACLFGNLALDRGAHVHREMKEEIDDVGVRFSLLLLTDDLLRCYWDRKPPSYLSGDRRRKIPHWMNQAFLGIFRFMYLTNATRSATVDLHLHLVWHPRYSRLIDVQRWQTHWR